MTLFLIDPPLFLDFYYKLSLSLSVIFPSPSLSLCLSLSLPPSLPSLSVSFSLYLSQRSIIGLSFYHPNPHKGTLSLSFLFLSFVKSGNLHFLTFLYYHNHFISHSLSYSLSFSLSQFEFPLFS